MSERVPPPEVVRALRRLRTPEPVPPAVRARLRARIQASIAATAPPPPPALGPIELGLLGLSLLGLVLLGGHAPARVVDTTPPAAPPHARVPSPPPEEEAPAPSESVRAPDVVVQAEPPRVERPRHAVRTREALARRRALDEPADEADEHALLEEARAALRQREPTRALTLLEAHAVSFPAGVLAEEREALLVRALLAAGRRAEAGERATRFLAARPASIFAEVVRPAIDASE